MQNSKVQKILKLSGIFLILPLFGLACSVVVPGSARENVSDSELHAVMSSQIDVLVRQLDVLIFDQHRTETELAQERQRRAARIAETAAELQLAADIVAEVMPALGLGESSAQLFLQLAGELKAQAAVLEAQARAGRVEAFEVSVQIINASCNACHELYREY